MQNLKKIFIHETETVQQALKKLSDGGKKILLVVDSGERLLGTLSDGDLRTYILTGQSLKKSIAGIFNINPTFLEEGLFSDDDVKKVFLQKVIELIPIIDVQKKVKGYITWDMAFSERRSPLFEHSAMKIPVIIMAGGRGTRLEPFTKVFPKPLFPIGERPVIEVIMEEFVRFGVAEFYLTLNYKGEMIVSYFNTIEKNYKINYIWEKSFLGTAGSLQLLPPEIKGDFVVSNCDIIVKADYADALKFHRKNAAAVTIISSMHSFKIPYGVIRFKKGGEVLGLSEKPEYTFTINAGVYIINSRVLKQIPPNTPLDMPQLINTLLEHKEKVLLYPINEGNYIDIGQWDEYKKAMQKIGLKSTDSGDVS